MRRPRLLRFLKRGRSSEVKAVRQPPIGLIETDQPWRAGDADLLGRAAFAQRIAHIIATLEADASLVIGVFGPWGEGKTSLLRMVDQEFGATERISTLWFNPWLFGGQEALVLAFLQQLASALEVRLGSASAEFKRVLEKYGTLLSAAPISVYGLDPGKAMTQIGGRLRGDDVESLKGQLEGVLERKNVRAVVFIDDIDRLDKSEIHAVLKLVKVTASFRRVTYVLAFDDTMVAAAVGEEFGGQADAGRSFLEKIIQVPLRLPRVEESTLLSLALAEVDRAVRTSNCTVTQEEVNEFIRYFSPLFRCRSRTLRDAKRLGNSLSFAIPLLVGEVRLGDLLLIEALRAFVPRIHAELPRRRELLLGTPATLARQAAENVRKAQLAELMDTVSSEERKAVTELLEQLFPRVREITSNYRFPAEWDESWASQQRAASDEYFDRYFLYSVPSNDVSDSRLRDLEEALADRKLVRALQLYDAAIITQANAERVVRKLRRRETLIPDSGVSTLVRLLAARGGGLPQPHAFFSHLTPQSQAVILAYKLLKRLPIRESDQPGLFEATRASLVEELVTDSPSIDFAAAVYYRIRYTEHDAQDGRERELNEEDQRRIDTKLAERLTAEWAKSSFYVSHRENAQLLLFMWRSVSGRDVVSAAIHARLESNPAEAPLLLGVLTGRAWSMETGLPLNPSFEVEQYRSLETLVEPETVYGALKNAVGSVVSRAAEQEGEPDVTKDRAEIAISRQFAWLFGRSVRLASAPKGSSSAPRSEG